MDGVEDLVRAGFRDHPAQQIDLHGVVLVVGPAVHQPVPGGDDEPAPSSLHGAWELVVTAPEQDGAPRQTRVGHPQALDHLERMRVAHAADRAPGVERADHLRGPRAHRHLAERRGAAAHAERHDRDLDGVQAGFGEPGLPIVLVEVRAAQHGRVAAVDRLDLGIGEGPAHAEPRVARTGREQPADGQLDEVVADVAGPDGGAQEREDHQRLLRRPAQVPMRSTTEAPAGPWPLPLPLPFPAAASWSVTSIWWAYSEA